MAETSTLARPYARAAFEYARENNALAEWSAQLATAAAVTGEPAMQAVLNNPSLTARQQADTLADVCGDALGDAARNFLAILADNTRLSLLPEISTQFVALKSAQEKSLDVEVVTPYELAQETLDKLQTALTRRLEREVRLGTTTDESLLGGLLIRAGDTVIDGSVRGRLNKLAEAMNS
jgi:F-type H+-transporting ATPase subunit delta